MELAKETRKEMTIVGNFKVVPCPRPRVTQKGITHYPKRYEEFKNALQIFFRSKRGTKPLITSPIGLTIEFYYAMPKSWSKEKRASFFGREHTQKPDLDNLVKSVLDGMNGSLIEDDSQVFSISAAKRWSLEHGFSMSITEVRDEAD